MAIGCYWLSDNFSLMEVRVGSREQNYDREVFFSKAGTKVVETRSIAPQGPVG